MSIAWKTREPITTIPAGWTVPKLSELVQLVNGYPFPSESFGPDGDMPLVRIRDLMATDFESYVGGYVPPSVRLRNGDVVIGMDGDFNLVLWNGGEAALNQRLCLLRPRPGVDIRFIAYALPQVLQIINCLTFSTTVKHLSSGDLLSERVPLPPLEEQRRISDFLDAETSRVDKLTNLQQQVALRLGERDQAVIDQEADYLIAAHGSTPFRRAIRKVEQGVSPQCENSPAGDGEWGVLKVSSVKAGRFISSENKRLPVEIAPELRYEVRRGDLLVTRANTPALVGSTAVVEDCPRFLMLCDKIFRIETSPGLAKDFVSLVSRASRIRDLCGSVSHGTSQSMANLKIEEIKRWPIPSVAKVEQKDAVRRVSNALDQSETLRTLVRRQLNLLAERRQALITAAVTGQLDVTTARSGVR